MKSRESKAKIIATVVITVITLAFTGFILLNSIKETEFTINETSSMLEINGLYSKEILIDENTEVTLISPLSITRRTNGSSIGNTKKGYFTIEGDLAVYLNLGDSTSDWIEIVNGSDYYYINLKSEDDTLVLLQDLLDLQ